MAKIEFMHIMFMTKIALADMNHVSDVESFTPGMFMEGGKPADNILNRWKIIIDSFVENGLL